MGRLAAAHAGRTTRHFFRAVDRATKTQDDLLAWLVGRNAGSDFGREHHFRRIRGYGDFRANVPIRPYDALKPYVDRVRQGDVGALLHPGERILMFALTSGTTAEPKYIPVTPRVLADSRRGWNVWGLKAILDHPGSLFRPIVQVTSPMNDHAAPSGVPCGAITGLLAETQKRLVRRYYTSPPAVSRIRDTRAKYYTIMRLAIPRDVGWIVTANPSTLLLLAKTADEHRDTLIRDVHDGTLCDAMPVDGAIRAALAPRLAADPACARRLEAILERRGGLYPKHYWRLRFRAHWCGGTMGLYASQFPRYYGSVPARDIGLIASEGRMSIPIEDETAAGILDVTSQFFEFIPADEYGSKHPTPLRSHELGIGGEYFLIITNAGGLYRYDLGDRVRVTGRVGAAPLIEFLSRDEHTASLAGEKLTEDQVVLAMRRVLGNAEMPKRRNAETPDRRIVETPGCEDAQSSYDGARRGDGEEPRTSVRAALKGPAMPDIANSSPEGKEGASIHRFVLAPRWAEVPRYRLYVEAGAARRWDRLPERLDKALCQINVEYAQKRSSLRLGAIELAALPDGVLAERDRRLRRARAHTAEQFKHQYLLPRPGLDGELEIEG